LYAVAAIVAMAYPLAHRP